MAKKGPKVYQAKISDFNQDSENANAGPPRGNALIELSLREHGAGRSLLADENNILIGGNKTQRQAEHAGIEELSVLLK